MLDKVEAKIFKKNYVVYLKLGSSSSKFRNLYGDVSVCDGCIQ
jgi:hypothetical protein